MGMMKKTSDIVDKIVETIKSFGDEGVTSEEIVELVPEVVSRKNFINNYCYRYLNNRADLWIKKEAHGMNRWFYKDPNFNKNSEGYSDPTASAAIKSAENKHEEKTPIFAGDFLPGSTIWVNQNDRTQLFLIFKSFPDAFVGWYVGMDLSLKEELPSYVTWISDGHVFTVFSHRLTSVKRSPAYPYSTAGRLYRCPMNAFREAISKFGGNVVEIPVEVEVEKVVERVVEVPAKVEKELVTDRIEDNKEHIELLLNMQRADIYEKAFYALLRGVDEVINE